MSVGLKSNNYKSNHKFYYEKNHSADVIIDSDQHMVTLAIVVLIVNSTL